jgi:hypothetical protein
VHAHMRVLDAVACLVVCGVRCAVCGVRCAVCGVRCVSLPPLCQCRCRSIATLVQDPVASPIGGMYCVTWVNIAEPGVQVGLDYDAFDVLLVKSNWEWGVDVAVRATLDRVSCVRVRACLWGAFGVCV